MLRLTLTLVPHGNENRARDLGQVVITNLGTGTLEIGSYMVDCGSAAFPIYDHQRSLGAWALAARALPKIAEFLPPSGTEAAIPHRERYYIQDTRQVVGNCALWWAKESKGYTCELQQAGLFFEEEAREIARNRDTDKAYPESVVRPLILHHVRASALRELRGLPILPSEAPTHG